MPETIEPIEPIKGWYVAENDLKTSNLHTPHLLRLDIREGETLTLDDPRSPQTCAFGYHASVHLLDAFGYRADGVITYVEVSGDVDVGHDKIAGRSRKTLRIIPREVSDKVSREFACDVAERLLLAEREAGREPVPESFKAIAVARAFAAGKATEEELQTAERTAAAWSAAAAERTARAAWSAAAAAEAAAWAAAAGRAAAGRVAAWAAEWAARAAAGRVAARRASAAEAAAGVAATAAAVAAWTGGGSTRYRELSLELEARLLEATEKT